MVDISWPSLLIISPPSMPIVVQVCLFLVFFMYYLRMVFVSSQSVVVPTSLTGRLVFSISRLWRTTRNRKWKDSKLSNEGCHCGMYKCFVYFLFTWQHGLFLEQYPLQMLAVVLVNISPKDIMPMVATSRYLQYSFIPPCSIWGWLQQTSWMR